MDRRKQRTRQMLRDSLMELILERGYDSITVQEITDHANMGRATFYLHFKDKEELLFSSLKETVDELTQKLSPKSHEDIVAGINPPSLIAFQHAAENRQLFRVMLNAQGGTKFMSGLRMLIADLVETQVKMLISPDLLPAPLPVIGQYAAGSLLALMTWWLETDAPYTPEEMALMMNRLTVQPLITSAMNSVSRSSLS
jgi:AcrR family transcriptional regulator